MKRIIVLIIVIIMIGMFLTGCQCKHEWYKATCDTAMTCAKCGEINGEPLGHQYTEATLEEPSICRVCGEEDPLGWSLSTSKIMGTWKAVSYFIDEEVIDGDVADFEARFVTDGTGYLMLEGEKHSTHWWFVEDQDGMLLYRVEMEGDTENVGYVTDPSNTFYNRLILSVAGDLVVFEKIS